MRRSWDAAPFTHCGSNCCVVCPFLNKTKTTCCPPWGIHPEGGPAEQAAYFSSTYYSQAKGEQPSGSDRTKSVEGLSVSAIQLFHGLLLPYFASCLFASMGLSRPIWGGVSRICRRTRPGPRSSGCCMPSNIWGGVQEEFVQTLCGDLHIGAYGCVFAFGLVPFWGAGATSTYISHIEASPFHVGPHSVLLSLCRKLSFHCRAYKSSERTVGYYTVHVRTNLQASAPSATLENDCGHALAARKWWHCQIYEYKT